MHDIQAIDISIHLFPSRYCITYCSIVNTEVKINLPFYQIARVLAYSEIVLINFRSALFKIFIRTWKEENISTEKHAGKLQNNNNNNK